MKKHILTWHVHGNYLYYLTQINFIFYIPVTKPTKQGFYGKTPQFKWGNNVIEIPIEEVKKTHFDCIIFQSNYDHKNPNNDYLQEQIEILSKQQIQSTPKIFIEHDPPRNHPTNTQHILYNSDLTLVHVTHFNKLMWDCGNTTTKVIEHGVTIPENVKYTGEIKKGIVVINNLSTRGRKLGFDIVEKVRKEIPLDIIGIGSEEIGGLGTIEPQKLPHFISKYRFLFHPARYTSLGLSVVEAMTIGLPIIGLATTELPNVLTNEKSGYTNTNIEYLIEKMKLLLNNKSHAKELGENAKKLAQQRFNITRFTKDWEELIENVISSSSELINKPINDLDSNQAGMTI